MGARKLVESPVDYVRSSAKFYVTWEQGIYLITDQWLTAAVSATHEPTGHGRGNDCFL